MEPGPQQFEQDVLIGTFKPPPLDLEMTGRRNGLLEDLVVLGNIPITEVIIGNVGLAQQDRRHQLPNRVSLHSTERITPLVTLSILGYDVPIWSVTQLQGGHKMYSPLGVI